MATFSTFLESIYRDGNDGKAFEHFVKWFLTHDPEWATQVDKVWLWDEYPDKWGNHLDLGTDLVFQHKNGELWGVQAKCYAETTPVDMEDVDSFISDTARKSISKRLLIISNNRLGRNAKESIRRQEGEKPVTTYMREHFERAKVDYPSDYKDLRKVKKKDKPGARPHQDTAITNVVKGFKNADRGQLIMACGTGKTFTTLWIKEKMKSQSTLVLLPSLNLLAQTVSEWSFASKSKIDVLCVCSDKSVGKKKDDEAMQSLSDVPFPVHSDITEIRKFMKGAGDKVIFSTYQSSDLIHEAQKGRGIPVFDLAVADEAHRCAISGKPDSPFATILDGKKIKATKRLFATATPRTYTTQVKKAAEERGVEVVGMDDEEAFGKPFHTLTFGEAIKNDPPLLTDYQVVIVGVDNAMVAEWIEGRELVATEDGETITEASLLASQIGLLKAMKDYNLKRVISFHSRVKRAEEFSEDIHDAATIVSKKHLPDGTIKADFVSGAMSTSDRGEKLKTLKGIEENEIGLLSNARCLSEGVDVPSLDGVAFIDPKNSQVDIIQAVGRAIRLSDEKDVGTIVLPVFIKDGEDPVTRIEESNFQPVWWVLDALKAHDDVLVDELDSIRTDMGRRGATTARPGGIAKVEVDLPASVGTHFADALTTHLVEQTTTSWDFWFGLLETYVSENSHALVPAKHKTVEGYRLGSWINKQRSDRDILGEERKRKLDGINGWIWDVREFLWEEGFRHLQDYAAENGDALVPAGFKAGEGFSLGNWVSNQRKLKSGQSAEMSELSAEKIERLESVDGWAWDAVEYQWNLGFYHLNEYIVENNHALVPHGYKVSDGYNLGNWVAMQRRMQNRMPEHRKEMLDALPLWIWDPYHQTWEVGMLWLEDYVEQNGTALVSAKYKTADGFKLGGWVRQQRYERDGMALERKERLESLAGWTWDVLGQQWEEGFRHLIEYVALHGSALIRGTYQTKDGYNLAQWVKTQIHRRDKLTKDRLGRLESLPGWTWDIFNSLWEEGYNHLLDYVSTHGTALVPSSYQTEGGFKLGGWVGRQRQNGNLLSDAKREKLDLLSGWVWNKYDGAWESAYLNLQEYVNDKGTALVPGRYATQDGFLLGRWVIKQRSRRSSLPLERQGRLSALNGWQWNTKT